MRLNVFIASGTGLSRRAADRAISEGRVTVNGLAPELGQQVSDADEVTLDGRTVQQKTSHTTIMFNKPVDCVCSRDGQGSKTIYDYLPKKYHDLKPIGRLDKNSSGLLLLTDDGQLANELTHPSRQKVKVYRIRVDKPLQPLHQQMITDYGVDLEDGKSSFMIQKDGEELIITMHEGRNRQIRRTFKALGYVVTDLRRTNFGDYTLGNLPSASFTEITQS